MRLTQIKCSLLSVALNYIKLLETYQLQNSGRNTKDTLMLEFWVRLAYVYQ
jgi:hypothetical protein